MTPGELIVANLDVVFQTVALAFHLSKSAEEADEPEIAILYDALASSIMLLLVDDAGLTREQTAERASAAYERMYEGAH